VFYGTDTLFDLAACHHKFSRTLHTSEPEVHSRANYKHLVSAAGMIFFHRQHIAGSDIQSSILLPQKMKNRTFFIIPQIRSQINILGVYFFHFGEK